MTDEETRLYELMKEWAQKPGQKVLLCGQDVLDWFREAAPRANKPEAPFVPSIYDMIAIEIHLAEDAPPRSWRLILHDACEVHYPHGYDHPEEARVVHEECTLIEEGSI